MESLGKLLISLETCGQKSEFEIEFPRTHHIEGTRRRLKGVTDFVVKCAKCEYFPQATNSEEYTTRVEARYRNYQGKRQNNESTSTSFEVVETRNARFRYCTRN